MRRFLRAVRLQQYLFRIRRHQRHLDAITMQRRQDDADAERIQGRMERHKHKVRALRSGA